MHTERLPSLPPVSPFPPSQDSRDQELLELFEKYGYTLEGKKRIADELHISLRTLYRRISHLKEELSKN